MMSCNKCKHSVPHPDKKEAEKGVYACRRYPPAPLPIMGVDKFTQQPVMQISFIFPAVDENLVCGEFKNADFN